MVLTVLNVITVLVRPLGARCDRGENPLPARQEGGDEAAYSAAIDWGSRPGIGAASFSPFKDEGKMTGQDRRCRQDEAGRYPAESSALGSGRAGNFRCHVSIRKSAAVLAAWIDKRAIRASIRA